ncbi:MAG: response regulator [Desulfatibacillum sp.]|nr:response regulator [Desulfatibacillum sp.]
MPFMEKNIRVLLVEDNPGDRDLVAEYLEMDSHTFLVDFASNLGEAIKKLTHEPFDVVLLDLGLPDSQGVDTVADLVFRFPSLPVIAVTGQDDDETARQAIRKGAQDYLVKGKISPELIQRAIRYAIDRKGTENELTAIYENAPVLMMLVDQDRRILRLNQLPSVSGKDADRKYTGLRGGDALQCLHALKNEQGCGNALECETCEIRKSVFHTLETGEPVKNLETRISVVNENQTRDIYLSVSTARIILNNEPKVLVALADITQRIQALEDLRRNEALLKATQSLTKIGGWEWDVEKKEMFWTDEVYNIHGFQKEAFSPAAGDHIPKSLECYPPEYRNVIMSAFNRCVERGYPYDYEFPFTKATGQKIWIRTTGHPVLEDDNVVRVVGNIMDITDRKGVEQELRKSEAFLNATGKMAKVGGWEIDAKTLDVRWTDVTYEIHEMPKSYKPTLPEAIGFFHEKDRARLQAAFNNAMDQGAPFDLELRFTTSKGKELWTHTKCLPVVEHGRTIRLLGTFQDITESKTAQDEKRLLQEQFQQAQKLESVGRLAGGVAHDLNNMLTPILGFGGMLMEDFSPDDTRREFAHEILNAASKAKDLVAQLLAFSRKQVLEFKSMNLNHLLVSFEKLLRRTIREDVEIRLNLAPSLPNVRGDIGQLEQVMMNLAVNAQDAMPEGGELTIETSVTELDLEHSKEFDNLPPGCYVVLSVMDTGSGMDPETRQQVFEPFFTTKTKDKGTGLGLSTVYGIIKQHNGTIRLTSQPGKGTAFQVYLPALNTDKIAEMTQHHESEAVTGHETILLVEDNPQVRTLARIVLKRQGYRVLEAPGGQEAITIIKTYTEPVHLLLTDVVMPEMSGKDLFGRLSGEFDIKVLYMSGYNDEIIANQGVSEEHVDFIQKPFSGQALAAKVRQVLDRDQ